MGLHCRINVQSRGCVIHSYTPKWPLAVPSSIDVWHKSWWGIVSCPMSMSLYGVRVHVLVCSRVRVLVCSRVHVHLMEKKTEVKNLTLLSFKVLSRMSFKTSKIFASESCRKADIEVTVPAVEIITRQSLY